MKVFRFAYIILALSILIPFLISSCSDDSPSGPDPNTNPNVVSQEIGPDGGEISSQDGRVILTFPEGALENTETITMKPLEESELGNQFQEISETFEFDGAWELGPDGLEFNEPVLATLPSDQNPVKNDTTISVSAHLLFISDNSSVEILDSLTVSADGDGDTASVTGQLEHFSRLISFESTDDVQINFEVKNVPDQLKVRSQIFFPSRLSIVFGVVSEGIEIFGTPLYEDNSNLPLDLIFFTDDEDTDDTPNRDPMNEIDENKSFEILPLYECDFAGNATFAATADVNGFQFLGGKEFPNGFELSVSKTVDCIAQLFRLSVFKDGNGNGNVTSDPGDIALSNGVNEHEYEDGTEVTLTSEPDEGSVFTGWSGDIDGQGEDCQQSSPQGGTCTVTMDEERSITATLEKTDSGGGDKIALIYNRQDEQSNQPRFGTIGADGTGFQDLGQPFGTGFGFLSSLDWLSDNYLIFEKDPSGDVSKVVRASTETGNTMILANNEEGAEDPSLTDEGDILYVQNSNSASKFTVRKTNTQSLPQSNGTEEIYIMQSNGSGNTQITDSPDLAKSGPVGSPDGRIYFLGQPDGENNDIYRVNRDGSNLTNLTNSPEGEIDVQVSPDGTHIAFSRTVEEDNRLLRTLWVANADGSGETQVAPELHETQSPDWAPDGSSLVFVGSAGFGLMNDVYRANADGSGVQNLTKTEDSAELDPDWAPSAEFVAYSKIFFDDELGESVGELFRMNPDGTGQTQLTDINGSVGDLAVQP